MITSKKSGNYGFTIIELMVVMVVIGVLLTLAAPSFIGFQRNSELTSLANKLVGSSNAARGEAMKAGRNAFVIPTSGSAWAGGWQVYVDMDGDNVFTAGTDVLVQMQPPVASYISISGNNNAGASSPYISFDSEGYARTIGGSGLSNLTLTIQRNDVSSKQTTEESRLVIVARTGRIRACKPSADTTCTSSSTS